MPRNRENLSRILVANAARVPYFRYTASEEHPFMNREEAKQRMRESLFESWRHSHPEITDDTEARAAFESQHPLVKPYHLRPKKPKKAEIPKPAAPKSKRRRRKIPRYAEYIKSAKWLKKSKEFRERAGKCAECGTTHRLQCHHKHYKTLGREQFEDILVVCYQCHCKLHGVDSFDDK